MMLLVVTILFEMRRCNNSGKLAWIVQHWSYKAHKMWKQNYHYQVHVNNYIQWTVNRIHTHCIKKYTQQIKHVHYHNHIITNFNETVLYFILYNHPCTHIPSALHAHALDFGGLDAPNIHLVSIQFTEYWLVLCKTIGLCESGKHTIYTRHNKQTHNYSENSSSYKYKNK